MRRVIYDDSEMSVTVLEIYGGDIEFEVDTGTHEYFVVPAEDLARSLIEASPSFAQSIADVAKTAIRNAVGRT